MAQASPAAQPGPAAKASPAAKAAPAAKPSPGVAASPVARPAASPTAADAMALQAPTTAANLRALLNFYAQEHVYLAGAALNAAVAGRDAEFKTAAAELDENSVSLSKVIGSVYGSDAEQQFLKLWRDHIGYFADYANAAVANNQQQKQQALQNLEQYRQEIGALLGGANPNLTQDAVAELFAPHVAHLTGTIDALAAENVDEAYSMLKTAADQSDNISTPLAAAIAKQFPDKFPGAATDTSADLRGVLNLLTQEHVYLAGMALNAAVSGREAEFKTAAATLDQNSVALANQIGSVYGQEAEQQFLELWRSHIGFFADYATAAVANDQGKKQQALQNLEGYRQQVGALLAGANPNLTQQAVADLFKPHVEHLTMTIDALAAKDVNKAYNQLHVAAHQSQNIASALAGAIIKQFPEKFS